MYGVCENTYRETRIAVIIHFIHGRLMNFIRKSFDIKNQCVRPYETVLKTRKREIKGNMRKNGHKFLSKLDQYQSVSYSSNKFTTFHWCVDLNFC